MRPRTLLVVVLILFCVRMSGRAPAAGPRPGPDGAPAGPQKVYPVSLRYRQQLDRQVRLPAPTSPAPPVRPPDGRPLRLAAATAAPPSEPALPSLLVRLQL